MEQREKGETASGENGRILENTCNIMFEINMLHYSIAAVENDMDISIQRIKKAAEAFSEPRRQRLQRLIHKLAKLAGENRHVLFGSPAEEESLAITPAGIFGFASVESIQPAQAKDSWMDVLEKVKNLGFDEAVIRKETVDFAKIGTFPDENLNKIGLMRKIVDVFWYKTSQETAISTEQNIRKESLSS